MIIRMAIEEHHAAIIVLDKLLLLLVVTTLIAVLGLLADGRLAHHEHVLLRSAAHLGGRGSATGAETAGLYVVLL